MTTKASLVTPEKEFHYFAQTFKCTEFSDIGKHTGDPHSAQNFTTDTDPRSPAYKVKIHKQRRIAKVQFVDYKLAQYAVKFLATGLQFGGFQSVPDA